MLPGKLPRGAYTRIAKQLGLSLQQVRDGLHTQPGVKPDPRIAAAAAKVAVEQEASRRLTAYRRTVRLASDAQLYSQLEQAEEDRKRVRLLDCFIQGDLIIGAFDYYCGRMTIAAGDFAYQLKRAWELGEGYLAQPTRSMLQLRLVRKFEAYVEHHATGRPGGGPLGTLADTECWLELLGAMAASPAIVAGPPSNAATAQDVSNARLALAVSNAAAALKAHRASPTGAAYF